MPLIIDYTPDGGGILVSTVTKRASLILQDEDKVRWTSEEMLEWVNEAVVATINANPAAGERDATLTLMQGARQELGDSVCQLMSITCNMDADGNAGRAVTRTDLSLMNLSAPDWQSMKRSSTIRQYMYEDRTPSVFYVYPPATAGARVRASLASIPEEVVQEADTVPIKVEYVDALVNYVCYRCFSKDSEFADGSIAAAFYGAFQQALGNESQGAQATSPNRNKA